MSEPKVKKAYVELVSFLNENITATVEEVMPKVLAMCAPKKTAGGTGTGATTYVMDTEGNTVAILDYYFKQWLLLVGDDAVDFGKKASSASGYSSMSKLGTSLWTKQQRDAKSALAQILVDVEEGVLDSSEIGAAREGIEATRCAIATHEFVAFDEALDARAALEALGVNLA